MFKKIILCCFLYLPVTLSLISCSPSKEENKDERELIADSVDSPGYIYNSCYEKFDQGKSLKENSKTQWKQSHFQKTFDESKLGSVLKVSAASLYQKILSDGGLVYKIPVRDSKACKMMQSLPKAPRNIIEFWFSKTPVGGFILGMFLPPNYERRSSFINPTILLREDTDRYTLVHEYFHFLFHQARSSAGSLSDVQLKEVLQLKAKEIEASANQQANAENIAKLSIQWISFVDLLIEFRKRYAMEEMAIEAILREYVNKGDYPNTTSYHAASSSQYIYNSWSSVKPELAEVITATKKLTDSISTESFEHRNLTALKDRVTSLIAEGDALVAKFASNKSARHRFHGFGCTHVLDKDIRIKIPKF